MRFKVWPAVLGALVLGACAHDHHHHYPQFVVPNPAQPTVVLRPDNQLVVNQEPLYVPKDGRVTFRLPPGSGLAFDPEIGVRVLGRIKNENFEIIPLDTRQNDAFVRACQPGRVADGKDGAIDPQAFVCAIPPVGKVAKGLYAYEINVVGPQGRIRVDPTFYPPDP